VLDQLESEHPAAHWIKRRAILAAVSGHFIEWYEFAVYGIVAVYVAASIFPSDDPETSLFLAWVAYAIAFFIRPIGGIALAHVGDKYGRGRALFTTVVLMSLGTVGMGLIPGFEAAGVAAPLAFVSLRLLQGFAVGGEMSSAVTYVMEHSDEASKSRSASWLAAGTFSAAVFGSLVAAALANALPPEAMISWGWRILFIAAIPFSIAAMILRRRAPEPPGFVLQEANPSTFRRAPIVETIRTQKLAILRLFALVIPYNVGLAVVFGGYTNELVLQGMPPAQTLVVLTLTYLSLVVSILVFGRLGDRLGRATVLALGVAGTAVMYVPLVAFGSTGLFPLAALGSVLFVIPLGLYATPIYRSVAELFPPQVRVTAGGLAFNATTAVASLVPAATLWCRTALGFEHGMHLFLAVSILIAVLALFWRSGSHGVVRA
jgi:MHS family proline/betaine transporter-like MFS transporter